MMNKMKKIALYICFLILSYGYGQELNLPVWTQYLADNDFVISVAMAFGSSLEHGDS